MTKAKKVRHTFSSPESIEKMSTLVTNRWQDIWTNVIDRDQAERLARKAQVNLAIQQYLSKTS